MNPPSPDDILQLVALIQDAAADPKRWPAFLEKWARTIGSNEAFFLMQDLAKQEAGFVNDAGGVTREHVFRRLFGLTPAESRLAGILMKGKSLAQAAEELDSSIATVRTHLKRIFSKTGTCRQPQLVYLLLTSLAPFDFKL